MIDQSFNAHTLLAAGASGLVALLFDSNAALVFAGFAGVLISLGLSGPRGFMKSIGWVTAGTISAAFVTPVLLHFLGPDIPPKGIAFLLGFAIMHFLPASLDAIKAVPGRISDRFFGGGR